jgi:hypothetical protein
MHKNLSNIILILIILILLAPSIHAENIDPDSDGSQYAWAENVGWINFRPSWGEGVTVTDTAVTGRAWGENIGWITLNPTTGGVVNDGSGNLSGYAWGENVGWINFNPTGGGVSIDPNTGVFIGFAWGENIGWINFNPTGGGVKTAWIMKDTDEDGIRDGDGSTPCIGGNTIDCDDNCISTPNPDQADIDYDGIGDVCDACTDVDGDGYATEGGGCGEIDCNDNDPGEYPQAEWYVDDDGDGYGDLNGLLISCLQPAGHVTNSDDCDDRPDGADGLPGTDDDGSNLNPGAEEVCDNLDNNCDGRVDENLTQSTTCGVGECVSIVIETCTAGEWSGETCTPGPKSEATDVTCDGLDGDCDGMVDEDYVTTETSCGVGQCSGNTGQVECQDGTEVDTCDPLAGSSTEVCDGVDNNCNGQIDESTCTATPEITSPVPGLTLSGSTETFTWTANGTAVSQWWLWIGSGQDILNSGSLGSSTSYTATGLPTDGRQIYVRLWYYVGGWQYGDFQYTAYTGSGGGGGDTPEMRWW